MRWSLHFAVFTLLAAQVGLADSSKAHLKVIEKISDFAISGELGEEVIIDLLHSFVKDGYLSIDERLFARAHKCIRVTPISSQNKGFSSGQVVSISYNVSCLEGTRAAESTAWKGLYILKETKRGLAEIDNLRLVNQSPIGDLRNMPEDPEMANIAFDDLHFVYRNGSQSRYFSLLRTAKGKSLVSYLKKVPKGEKVNVSREKRMFYRVGYALSQFHQLFEDKISNGFFNPTFIHGDCHAQNIFYEEETGIVTLIDNETFALGLKKKSSGINDIVDLYLLHTAKTIAHRYARNLRTNRDLGIDDDVWHSLIHQLFLGYLEGYELSDLASKLELFNTFAEQVLKELSAFRTVKTLSQWTDQRKQKRVGLSWRRLVLKEKYVVSLLQAVKNSFVPN